MTAFIALSTGLLLLPRALVSGRPSPPTEFRGLLGVLWRLNRLYCAAMHRLVLLNEAPIPATGPAILVANHTCGIDHLILQAGCRRVLGFMIAREYHEFFAIRPFSRLVRCIPVNRDGRDLGATREALRALEQGRVLPIFPEGRITPTSGLEFGPGKPGAAFLTLRAGVPVFPAYIRGTPETRNVWKAVVTPSRARVLFGPPIDLDDLRGEPADRADEKARISAATDRLMGAIRALRPESLALEPS